MSDLISRQDAIDAVKGRFSMPVDNLIAEVIGQLPSAQPERKTGHWIDMGDFEQCSVCNGTQLKEFQTYYGKAIWMRTPYCPNCGARMREEQNDE